MEPQLSGSLSNELFFLLQWNLGYQEAFSRIFLSHDGILAVRKPFTRTFLSHDGISAIMKPFHEFFFHTMESRLSRSLLTNFSFTWWNLGYHEAFSRIFLSHDGILAITKPFHEFFFHTMESRLSGSPSHDGIHKLHNLGEDSFRIYHKEYLHRIRLVKNLASWFRTPFARKIVRSFLF
jgi:hypothetical protein